MLYAKTKVLIGYQQKQDETILINSPIWEDISDSLLETMKQNGNKYALCRIQKLNENVHTDVPLYDEYFLIDLNETSMKSRGR